MHRGDARVDHQVSPKNMLFFRYTVDWADIQMPNTFNDAIGGNENSFAGDDRGKGPQLGRLVDSRHFLPTTIGDFPLRLYAVSHGPADANPYRPVWGLIAVATAANPLEPTAPIIGMTGYAGLGAPRSEPLIRDEYMHEAIGGLSMLKGNHSLQVRRRPALSRRWRDRQPARRKPRSDAGISTQLTRAIRPRPADTGDAIASHDPRLSDRAAPRCVSAGIGFAAHE